MKITSYIARASMKNQSNKMDVISDNIANLNTNGFKRNTVNFKTTLHNLTNDTSPINSQITNNDSGSVISSIRKDYSQGALLNTTSTTDFAISGDGFFAVLDEKTGEKFYTRDGHFLADSEGVLRDLYGRKVVVDDSLGSQYPDNIVVFSVKEIDMIAMGNNFFVAKEGSDIFSNRERPEFFGKVVQGVLEQSNVDLSEEFTDMIITQRAYSMNSKIFQVADEVSDLINNIKR